MKGMSVNIRDALYLEYYKDLEHVDLATRTSSPSTTSIILRRNTARATSR